MKIKLSFSIFLITLVGVLFWLNACKQEKVLIDYSLKNMSQLVEKYNVNRSGIDKGMIEKGKARIVSTQNNFYVVQFQNLDSKRNTFFTLEAKEVTPNFGLIFSDLELIHMGGSLILNSLKEDYKILLQIGEQVTYPEISAINFKYNFTGFGLGKYPNHDRLFLTDENTLNSRAVHSGGGGNWGGGGPITPIIPDLSCGCHPNGDSNGCKSGGTGSSSCSMSTGSGENAQSCSTTCQSGYYACCNE
jgi:hypothetical protein